MNILFICKHNRFRSRAAEALFNKLNKNKSVKAKSAGVITGGRGHRHINRAAAFFGINIKGKPRSVTKELLDWADIVVIVADDVPEQLFRSYIKGRKKMLIWKIRDFIGSGIEPRKKIINAIKNHIDKLVKEASKK